jgi:hypothetical protein
MHLVAAIDEVASETQLSEGWTYAILPPAAVAAIDAAVSSCTVREFHGRTFKTSEADDYRVFLNAAQQQLKLYDSSRLVFTLLDPTWKTQFLSFARKTVTTAMQKVGISDPTAQAIAEHLFPGLITFQRLADKLPPSSLELEIDSDSISKLLGATSVKVSGVSLSLARILAAAYEGHRKVVFPQSPSLVSGGVRALDDAHSRCIQVADAFGNFALSRVFVHLGQTSNRRSMKAQILDDVFGEQINASSLSSAVELAPPNDIRIIKPGGLRLVVGLGA